MGSTTKSGFYSKDSPPAIVSAPPRRVATGLAPWLHQTSGIAPIARAPMSGAPATTSSGGGGNWYDASRAAFEASSAAAVQQRQEQLRQAELLRQQQAAELQAQKTQGYENVQYNPDTGTFTNTTNPIAQYMSAEEAYTQGRIKGDASGD